MSDINLLPQELRKTPATSSIPKKPVSSRIDQPLITAQPLVPPSIKTTLPPPLMPRPQITVMSSPVPFPQQPPASSMHHITTSPTPMPPSAPQTSRIPLRGNAILETPSTSPSEITKITLIPETKEKALPHIGHSSPWLIPGSVAILALLVNGVWGILFITTSSALSKQQTEENTLAQQVENVKKKLQPQIVLLQQASTAQNLLAKHGHMSRFFTLLEQATLPTTTYEYFTLSESIPNGKHGTLMVLTPSFTDMAAQITLFLSAHTIMNNVTYNAVRREKTEMGEQVRASVEFDVAPSALST